MRLFIFIFILLSANCFAQGTWTQKNNMGGVPRWGAVGFSIDGKGYIGLGKGTSWLDLYNDLWEYNLTTDTWSQKADFPGGDRCVAIGISVNGKGYVGTGHDPNQNPHDDFWEYNPQVNNWVQKANFPGGNRASMVSCAIGSDIYLGTGEDLTFETYSDWWKYSPSTDTWTELTSLPGSSRAVAAGFSANNKAYLCTGINLTFGNVSYLNDLWEYDPSTDSWIQKANFPGGSRSEAHGFALNEIGYLGLGTTLVGSGTVSDIWQYHPSTDSWIQISDFGGGKREMVSGFLINCKYYIGTGWVNDENQQSDIWELSIDSCFTDPSIEEILDSYSIPNVFTPNNDLINDFWTTNFIDETEHMQILNRWGNLITTLSIDTPRWDGTLHGKDCSEGVYYYKGLMRGESKHGFLHLIR